MNFTINKKLDRILTQYNADRAYVFKYKHNGTFYLACNTHQRTRIGVLPAYKRRQSIPCGLLTYLTSNLVKKGELRASDVEALDWSYKQEFDKDIKSAYMFGIYSRKGGLSGFWGMDFIQEKVVLSKEELSASAVRF